MSLVVASWSVYDDDDNDDDLWIRFKRPACMKGSWFHGEIRRERRKEKKRKRRRKGKEREDEESEQGVKIGRI